MKKEDLIKIVKEALDQGIWLDDDKKAELIVKMIMEKENENN